MSINPRYLIYHDLIGLEVLAKNVSRPKYAQFTNIGTVVDESRNMLITENREKVKKYIKKDHIFRFKIPKNKEEEQEYLLEVVGTKIVGVPENRLRSLKKKRWLRK
jgi:RNase P/RNase MRP subunit p29